MYRDGEKRVAENQLLFPQIMSVWGVEMEKEETEREREKVGRENSINYTKSESSRKGGERTGKDKIRERWMVMLGEG